MTPKHLITWLGGCSFFGSSVECNNAKSFLKLCNALSAPCRFVAAYQSSKKLTQAIASHRRDTAMVRFPDLLKLSTALPSPKANPCSSAYSYRHADGFHAAMTLHRKWSSLTGTCL